MEQFDQIIVQQGLEEKTAVIIRDSYQEFFKKAQQMAADAMQLTVKSEKETDKMIAARESRLLLKEIRVKADKVRKELKADSLKYSNAVQGVYKKIFEIISPAEKHLEDQEKFIQIREEKRIEKLRSQRLKEVAPYCEFIPASLDIGGLAEDDYIKTLNGAKLQFEDAQRIKDEQAAEAAKERKRIEKIRQENERVQKENERIRNQNEKLKREKLAKENEVKAAAAREAAEAERLESAGDQEKLKAFAVDLVKLNYPEVKAREAKSLINMLKRNIETFIREVNSFKK